MKTFTMGEKEFPVVVPKGKDGRKATNYLLTKFMGKDVSDRDVFALLDDPHFELHLPTLIGVPQEVLDTEGTTTEILNAIFAVIEVMMSGFKAPEVDAALKN